MYVERREKEQKEEELERERRIQKSKVMSYYDYVEV